MEIDNSSTLVQIDELDLDDLVGSSLDKELVENDLTTMDELEQMLETETIHTREKRTIPYTEKPLNQFKEPSSKLVWWRLKLEEYDYEIKYKKGKQNKVADTLSRIKLTNNNSKPVTKKIKLNSPN